jgi:DNA-binding HxlR family transcriptional regulator
MSRPIDPTCKAFQAAIDVLGRPWTGLILGLLQAGPLRYGELHDRAHGVGDKILAVRLKDLEARRLVVRRVDVGRPVRVEYELTTAGRAFGHVAAAIERWGRELVPPVRSRSSRPIRAALGKSR